jgi:uncharacterized protein YgbK (DUF1537 family)
MSALALAPPRAPAVPMPLGLIADDLTGALDAAAPFARPDAPVAVLHDAGHERGSFALDAGTRGAAEAEAIAAAMRHAGLLRQIRTAFRKIDSLLRGHCAAEIAATARGGRFASVVVAPAFPAQGRIMLQGRQYARHADGTYRLIEVDLARELVARGLTLRALPHVGAMAGAGAFLCDAEYDSDLSGIVAARPRLKPPVLWCGSAGLARALAGAVVPLPLPVGPCLGIVGTRHPVGLAELDMIRTAGRAAVFEVRGLGDVEDAAAGASKLLARDRSALLALRLPAVTDREAAAVLDAVARAAATQRPPVLFASGGDTLAALRDATGARRLDVVGEAAPGIPISRLVGGSWAGVTVVSKSGAFAGIETLVGLFNRATEVSRVPA